LAYYGSPVAGDRRARMVVISVVVLGTAFVAVMLVMANSLGKLAETKDPAKGSAGATATASAVTGSRGGEPSRSLADAAPAEAGLEPGRRTSRPGAESDISLDQALAAAEDRMGQPTGGQPGGITMDPTGNRVSPVGQDQIVDQGYVGSGEPDSAPRGVASDPAPPPDLPAGYEGRGRSSPDVVTSPGS
jgi:hypothetical protein